MKNQIFKKYVMVLIIITCASNILFAQTLSYLTGVVKQKNTNEPLSDANVYFKRAECGTVTDKDGYFRLNCPSVEEDDSLVVHYIGFKEFRIAIKDFNNSSEIYLEPQSIDSKENVVVYGERINISKYDIPQTSKVMEIEEISRSGSSEITDLLKPLPSINIEGNDLDGKTIQIRGSDADEVNVYIDGILINHLQFNDAADLSLIPVESIERLEVISGGNSTLLGSGAFGGVINITTQQSTKTEIYLKGSMGSYKSRYLTSHIGLPITNKIILNYFGQLSSFSPEIEFFPGEQYTNKTTNNNIETSKQNHHVSLSYFTRKGQLSARFLSYFYDYSKPSWESEYNNYLSALTYQGSIMGIKNLDININHFYSDDKILRGPLTTNTYRSTYQSSRFNAKIAKRFTYQTTDLQFLAEYFHDELDNKSNVIYPEFESTLYSASIYDNRLSFAAVLNLNDQPKQNSNLNYQFYVGGRSDILANGDNFLTNMIGIKFTYQLEKWNISPFINYGQNVKHPTLLESAYLRDITDVTQSDSVLNRLEAEYSTSGDFGVHLSYDPQSTLYKNMEIEASFFSRTVYNKILRRPFDNLIAQVPTGRNETRGIEGSVKLNDLMSTITISASYLTLSLDNPLPNAFKPEEKASLNLNFNSRFGLFLYSTFFYEGKSTAWYLNENNEIQTEGFNPFSDMDLSVGFKLPINKTEVKLQVSANNIFDNSGYRYYYLKKRHLQFSLSFDY